MYPYRHDCASVDNISGSNVKTVSLNLKGVYPLRSKQYIISLILMWKGLNSIHLKS